MGLTTGLSAASFIFLLWFCVAYFSIAMLDGRGREEITTVIFTACAVWLAYMYYLVSRHA